MRRVVVTGIGMVSPLGGNANTSWANILNGQSGLGLIDRFDITDSPAKVAGLVPLGPTSDGLFHADDWVPAKDQRRMDPFIVYGIAAAVQAVEDSGWKPADDESREKTGVLIGSGIGGVGRISETAIDIHENGTRRVSPFFIPASLINLISGHVSIRYGFQGPNHAVVTACSTGAHAIGDAMRLIQWGDADVMVAGGAEAAVTRVGLAGFVAARAVSTSFNDTPTRASRPWDRDRDGFVMGEGAGVVVLEELEHAKKRGAKIYGEIIGYGLTGDAYHITAPSPTGSGAYRAMINALKRAEINPNDVGYVNAHGTSTPLGDEIELGVVKRVFGSCLDTLSMSSTKSAIGHLLGAAGGVEAIFTVLAIQDGILPPTLNLDHVGDGCDGIDLIPHQAKSKKIRYAVSNSFGFGGTNASLVFAAYTD